jgi:hypothetical protein
VQTKVKRRRTDNSVGFLLSPRQVSKCFCAGRIHLVPSGLFHCCCAPLGRCAGSLSNHLQRWRRTPAHTVVCLFTRQTLCACQPHPGCLNRPFPLSSHIITTWCPVSGTLPVFCPQLCLRRCGWSRASVSSSLPRLLLIWQSNSSSGGKYPRH